MFARTLKLQVATARAGRSVLRDDAATAPRAFKYSMLLGMALAASALPLMAMAACGAANGTGDIGTAGSMVNSFVGIVMWVSGIVGVLMFAVAMLLRVIGYKSSLVKMSNTMATNVAIGLIGMSAGIAILKFVIAVGSGAAGTGNGSGTCIAPPSVGAAPAAG